jgi:hypothetical protein
MAPEESIQDHAASAMAASILAMILSKDRAVQRKGCAWAFRFTLHRSYFTRNSE